MSPCPFVCDWETNETVEVLISDEGRGFDPGAVAWEAPQDLLPSGRGTAVRMLCRRGDGEQAST